ncbi:flavin reductase family protein [Actinomyces ruminis]|nr:flavin reductase family protein [Actinomyces ruminis]
MDQTAASPFRPLPDDKWQWHPSPVPGQIVYVTTHDAENEVNLAPKSWVSMAAFRGPIIGFGCSERHRTCANATATGRFTLNFPTTRQAERVAEVADAPRRSRLAVAGLTLEESHVDGAPHLLECPAYADCSLVRTVRFDGGEVFLFGRIEILAMHEELLRLPIREAYARLTPALFCEPGVVGEMRLGPEKNV